MRPQTPGGGVLPTGTYTLLDGITTLASGNRSTQAAKPTTPPARSPPARTASPGSTAATANFTGSTTSTPLAITVTGKINTGTTLSVNNATSTYGTAVTGTVTVSPSSGNGTPTGTVTMHVDSVATTSTCTLSSGSCTYSVSGITATGHTLTASYGGDTNYNGSGSTGMSITVNQATQTINFTAPATPVTYGVSPITLVATGGASGNTVTFSIDGTSTGTGSISGTTLTVTGVGTLVIDANQLGNTNYSAATQMQQSIVVNQEPVTLTLSNLTQTYTGSPLFPTITTTITSSGAPVTVSGFSYSYVEANLTGGNSDTVFPFAPTVGGRYSVSATVTDPRYIGSAANAIFVISPATQMITFAGPSTPVNYGVSPITLSATASSGQSVTFTLDSASTAGAGILSGNTLTILGVGSIVIDANQSGNNDYSAATQVQRTLVVSNGTTLTVTAANASRVYGAANPTFTANYTGQQGTDSFTATASSTATAASPVVAGGYAIVPNVVAVAPASLNNYTVVLHNGTLTITQATASVALVQTVPTTTGVGTGVSTTFVATVSDSSNGSTGTPTGSVQFLDGSTPLGTVALSGSTATFTTTFATTGTHYITAAYLGDNNFAANTSGVFSESVVTPGFTGVANPSTLTIAQGNTGMSTLTFTPTGNYQGSLTLSCNGLPVYVSCVFNPATIVFTGNNAVQTSTLTVYTLNASARSGASSSGLLWIPAGMLACLVAMRRKKLARGMRPLLMIAIAALALTAMTGCGASPSFVTPTGTTVTTVTASAVGAGGNSNSSQSISLTIIITP